MPQIAFSADEVCLQAIENPPEVEEPVDLKSGIAHFCTPSSKMNGDPFDSDVNCVILIGGEFVLRLDNVEPSKEMRTNILTGGNNFWATQEVQVICADNEGAGGILAFAATFRNPPKASILLP